jgi:hypothetical protein
MFNRQNVFLLGTLFSLSDFYFGGEFSPFFQKYFEEKNILSQIPYLGGAGGGVSSVNLIISWKLSPNSRHHKIGKKIKIKIKTKPPCLQIFS